MARREPAPFTVQLAIAWTGCITAVLWLGLGVVFLAFGRGAQDIVLLGLTQVAVYALVISAFSFVQQAPLRELLALRGTSLGLCLVAAALGAALQIPATLLSNIVEHFYPLSDAVLRERLARITPHSTLHGVAIFAVVAGMGPLVEELFFRGALFGALRRGYGRAITVGVVSLCFALGHLDLRLFLPLFVTALAIGEVREHSASIWPGVALHMAFNATTLAAVFSGATPNGKPPPMPLAVAIFGCVMSAALLVFVRSLAAQRRSNLE